MRSFLGPKSLISTAAAVAGGSSAFSASNTVPTTQAGQGAGSVSGYTVTSVTFTISFTAGTAKLSATFGAHLDDLPVAPQPTALPNSAPVAIKGGSIKVS